MPVVRGLRVLLRSRDFRRLLTVRLLSQLADGVYQVALAAHVVFSPEDETSAAAIAAAMAILLLPYSLLGPFAGVLLDRWRRRQVLLYGNLLRTVLATGTAVLIVAEVPDGLFYASALSVTAVNRFVLAGLSASLPRVVNDGDQLVTANSFSPTAGTLAATAGGGCAFVVRLAVPEGVAADAAVVMLGAIVYLAAGLAALSMPSDLLGPLTPARPGLRETLSNTARGLGGALRHLAERQAAARALASMAAMRFCYGLLTVMLLTLCRHTWSDTEEDGLALLGLTVGVSGAGFFVAALVTPWASGRLGGFGWISWCAGAAAVLEPALGLSFTVGPALLAAFLAGFTTQGAKIATDTIVQSTVDDDFRGRAFALYDMLFNVAFVAAAAVTALLLPSSGRSVALLCGAAALYATAAFGAGSRVSRETLARPSHLT